MSGSGLDELLKRLAAGDETAVQDLLPRIYGELRSIAGLYMSRERSGHSLQPTALVHEAYIRLLGDGTSGPVVGSRSHFLALAARAMRQILVEHARARGRQKRGGGAEHVEIRTDLGLVEGPDIEILALHEALIELSDQAPRGARSVELLFFGGLTAEEAGQVLGVSSRTVERDLQSARVWLRKRLDRDIAALHPREKEPVPPRAEPVREEEPPTRIGRYPIFGTLGTGGSGTVYLAHDPSLQREIALKRLSVDLAENPEAKALLREEARMLAALQHPNIATVFSLEDDERGPFLTLERIDGPSLAEVCRQGALPYLRALEIVRQVAHAMEAAAQMGIVHGDLTPANVLLTSDGRAKVVDFGLARRRPGAPGHSPDVRGRADDVIASPGSTVVAGTPGYMSPEQTRGESPSAAGDVFAFGCLLFEALTGEAAFPGETSWERIAATRASEPRWDLLDSSSGGRISPLARRCLSKSVAERPTSMRQARRRLEVELLRLRAERGRPATGVDATQSARRTRLPLPKDQFVGRAALEARIVSLLADHSLISLLGPGGVGKTRLALEVARRLEDEGQSVVFVDLTRTASLAEALAETLEIQVGADQSGVDATLEAAEEYLGESSVLVVLDGCEARREEVIRFLGRPQVLAGRARVLATSRARLGLPGEERIELAPLPETAAAELFVRRAEELGVTREFEPTRVAQLCSQLEGLPLALELAAARLRTVSLDELIERARDLRTLGSAKTDRPERHRNLMALVAWSEQLLLPETRRLFQALGLFAPGWDLEAVEAVAEPLGLPKWQILDVLSELIDHSLVLVDRADSADTVSYRMLDSISSYAVSRCRAEGRWKELTQRITEHYLRHVETEAERLRGPHSRAALTALGRTRPNWLRCLERLGLSLHGDGFVRPASGRSDRSPGESDRGARKGGGDGRCTHADLITGLRLVAALEPYWNARGLWPEARGYADAILGRVPSYESPEELADDVARPLGRVYNLRGNIALFAGDLDRAEQLYEQCLTIGESLEDATLLGLSFHNLGGVALHREQWDDAISWFQRSIAHEEKHGALRTVAIAYTNLGLVAERQERWDDASGYYTQALEIARGVGDERLVGIVLNNLAGVALIRDQGNEAVPAIEESIAHHRRLDDPLGEAGAQINLGAWFTDSHQPEAARSAFLTAVKLARGQGNVYILLRALAALALGEHRANQPEMAVRLHALARAARGDLPESVHSPRHLREIKRSLEQLRDTVDPAVFDRAWKEGASLSLDDLLATLGSGGRDESPEAKSS